MTEPENSHGSTADFIGNVLMIIAVIGLCYLGLQLPMPFKMIGILLLIAILLTIGTIIYAMLDSASSKVSDYSIPEIDNLLALESARDKVEKIREEHIERLAHRRNILIHVDHYGVVDSTGWNKEVQHFVDNVVRPKFTDEEAAAVLDYGMNEFFQEEIDRKVLLHSTCSAPSTPLIELSPNISPTEFEELCASVLRSEGWEATTTKGSGDQGADVIATKNNTKLVIQCKLYSGSVGNKAVQEAIAAKTYYQANLAAVVTNSYFTQSAKELANSAGVILMDNFDLKKFAEEYR